MAGFDYDLPEDRIAQAPADPRDSARLLVDRGPGAQPDHLRVSDLATQVGPGDVVVVNNTRVLAARLPLAKSTGGAVEVFLLEPLGDGGWSALVKPSKRVQPGSVLSGVDGCVSVMVGARLEGGTRRVEVRLDQIQITDVAGAVALDSVGETPLPPYIQRRLTDAERYQTVYSELPGSVAAPTAGLHLTADLMSRIQSRGASIHTVELVVGLDTFRPVMVDDTDDHEMHSEAYDVPDGTLEACAAAERVIAIGTTTVRALESAALGGNRGRTDLFIQRGFEWQVVDSLMTNFHMPRSTLLVMIDAFTEGRWRETYLKAMANDYRFLSFGDAMLLHRRSPGG